MWHDIISRTDDDDNYDDDDKGGSGDDKERRRITTEGKSVCVIEYKSREFCVENSNKII
jgi:hypothetical protein